MAGVKLSILDPGEYIRTHDIQEVTTTLRTDTATGGFHPGGLFSEEIFGGTTDEERMDRFGYIDLKTRVFHPKIYRNLIKLKTFYYSVLSGDSYGRLDPETGFLEPASEDDEGSGTGFNFFVSIFPKMKFKRTDSFATRTRIDVIEKNRDIALTDKYMVIPAGLRDYRMDDTGRGQEEEINKLYAGIITLTKALDPKTSERDQFNTLRLNLQKRCNAVYEHLDNMVSGKGGYLQGKFGKRNLALGSRNVISASKMHAESVDDERFHSMDMTRIPLIVAMSSFQPIICYQIKHTIISHVMTADHEQVSTIEPGTLKLSYHPIKKKVLDRMITTDGLDEYIELFKSPDFREKPVTVQDPDGNDRFLYLVYDTGDTVRYFRNIEEFQSNYEDRTGNKFDRSLVRPLTYAEMFYMAAYMATRDRFVSIVRYPAIEMGSCFITKVYVTTTGPSRKVDIVTATEDETFTLPDYPVFGNEYIDSTQVHPCRLRGLGGDYDGDQVSNNSIMNLVSAEECEKHLNSKGYLVEANGSLSVALDTDVLKLVFYNLSKFAIQK